MRAAVTTLYESLHLEDYLLGDCVGVKVPDIEENVKMCMCSDCPTFKDSPLSGVLFCAKGKADEDVLEGGCLCWDCPVSDKYSLDLEYYCVGGKSAEIPP